MAHKTKATMQGRQCNNTKLIQNTRLAAGGQIVSKALKSALEENQSIRCALLTYGQCNPLNHLDYSDSRELANSLFLLLTMFTSGGQSLSRVHFCILGTAPLARLGGVPVVGPTRRIAGIRISRQHNFAQPVGRCEENRTTTNQGCANFSAYPPGTRIMSRLGCQPSAYTPQSFGSSLAFLRCSAFSLRPQASRTHAEKLAPGFSDFSHSTLASIASISSFGNRIPLYEDLLFLFPVAITRLCCSYFVYTHHTRKNGAKKALTCLHTKAYSLSEKGVYTPVCIKTDMARPRSARTLAGPLTTNVSLDNEAAMKDHTQTHPKKVVLPYVRRYSAEVQAALDPFVLVLYRERREMLQRFKQALEAAGVEYVEADHE